MGANTPGILQRERGGSAALASSSSENSDPCSSPLSTDFSLTTELKTKSQKLEMPPIFYCMLIDEAIFLCDPSPAHLLRRDIYWFHKMIDFFQTHMLIYFQAYGRIP